MEKGLGRGEPAVVVSTEARREASRLRRAC